MSMAIRLDQMTTAEKLELMDLLWEDLSRNPDDIPSPDWHGEILREIEMAIADGSEQFTDWEEAKVHIREALK